MVRWGLSLLQGCKSRSLGHHVGHDVAKELIGHQEAAEPTSVLVSFVENKIATYSKDAEPQDEATIV